MPSFEDNVTGVQEGVTSLVMVDGPTLMFSYPGGLLDPFSELFVSDVMIFAIILVYDVLQDFLFSCSPCCFLWTGESCYFTHSV